MVLLGCEGFLPCTRYWGLFGGVRVSRSVIASVVKARWIWANQWSPVCLHSPICVAVRVKGFGFAKDVGVSGWCKYVGLSGSWVHCPWWSFGRRIYSRLHGGHGSGHVVLAETLSTDGCVGCLPLFGTMSGWVVWERLMGWWRCPGCWLVGRCWICSRRLCRV